MEKQIDDPRFIIYRAENGWALYIPKDDSTVKESMDMMTDMMGKFGLGGDPILEKVKSKNSVSKIHGLFLFDTFGDMIGFIKTEFEQEVESKSEAK